MSIIEIEEKVPNATSNLYSFIFSRIGCSEEGNDRDQQHQKIVLPFPLCVVLSQVV